MNALVYRPKNGPAVWAWDTSMSPMWRYRVIANCELAEMQGVAPDRVQPVCVIDDFGNLVRVTE